MQSPKDKYKVFKLFEPDLIEEFRPFLDGLPRREGIDSLVSHDRTPEKSELQRYLKRNFEAGGYLPNFRNRQNFPQIDAWVFEYLNLSDTDSLYTKEWNEWILPKNASGMMYSYMTEGCYYRPHIDAPENGNFSSTLFLENPNNYDGGELELLVDDELLTFKLEPGYCVTYETGIPHQVKTVTKGTRKCCVWWVRSHFSKMEDLYEYREYSYKCNTNIPSDYIESNYPYNKDDITDDLIEFSKKEHVHWQMKLDQKKRESFNLIQ